MIKQLNSGELKIKKIKICENWKFEKNLQTFK